MIEHELPSRVYTATKGWIRTRRRGDCGRITDKPDVLQGQLARRIFDEDTASAVVEVIHAAADVLYGPAVDGQRVSTASRSDQEFAILPTASDMENSRAWFS